MASKRAGSLVWSITRVETRRVLGRAQVAVGFGASAGPTCLRDMNSRSTNLSTDFLPAANPSINQGLREPAHVICALPERETKSQGCVWRWGQSWAPATTCAPRATISWPRKGASWASMSREPRRRKLDPLREVLCCSCCYYDNFHILNIFQEHFASSFSLQIRTAVLKETDK